MIYIIAANNVRVGSAADVVLGEEGRGRRLVRPVFRGVGPDATSVAAIPTPGGGVVLIPGNELLVRINTLAGYRRDARGRVAPKTPGLTRIATGYHAFGHAGGLGTAEDSLWRVERVPALWWVKPTRGEGLWVFMDREMRVTLLPTRELAARIVAGDEELTQAVREADDLPQEVLEALALADTLPPLRDDSPALEDDPDRGRLRVLSLLSQTGEEVLRGFGLRPLPDRKKGGFTGKILPGGFLEPGDGTLVAFAPSHRGARYAVEGLEFHGLLPVAHRRRGEVDYPGQIKEGEVLALVQEPDWFVRYRLLKDGAPHADILINARGLHWNGELLREWE
ncbi:hypothetical protein [Fervidobacterium sp.]